MANYTPNYNLKKPIDSEYYDVADQNGNMDKIDTALNTLNSKITGNSYSNSGLTFTDCALVVGGYAKCGNIVIINMRLSVTSASPKINGFPAYGQQLSSNKNAVSCSMSDSSNTLPSGAESYLTYSGELRLYNCNTSNEYIVSTVYISNS